MNPQDPRLTLRGKRIEFEEVNETAEDGSARQGFRLLPGEGRPGFEVLATPKGFTVKGEFTLTTHQGLQSLAELMGNTYKKYKRLKIKDENGTLGAPKDSDSQSPTPTKSGLIL